MLRSKEATRSRSRTDSGSSRRASPSRTAASAAAAAAAAAAAMLQRADHRQAGGTMATHTTPIPATMRAVVLDAPGPPDALKIREVPVPIPRPGWTLIRVTAFVLTDSELHVRLDLAHEVTFPRDEGNE